MDARVERAMKKWERASVMSCSAGGPTSQTAKQKLAFWALRARQPSAEACVRAN